MSNQKKNTMLNSDFIDVSEFKSSIINRNFNVKKLLGAGSYGKVYEVQSKRYADKIYAVKYMPGEYYERETAYLLQLKHSNIIKVFYSSQDYYINQQSERIDVCFIIMEKCSGSLIDYLLENEEIQWSKAKSIMRQILAAVDFLHKNSVMHRDIKPDNILMTAAGQVKLTDFGDCVLYEPRQAYSLSVGSLWYVAPEILLGNSYYTLAVDMWSVGCVFLIIVTLTNYLKGSNESDQLRLIRSFCEPKRIKLRKRIWSWLRFRGGLRQKYSKLIVLILRENFRNEHLIDFINRLLEMNPQKRLTAHNSLFHRFFFS